MMEMEIKPRAIKNMMEKNANMTPEELLKKNQKIIVEIKKSYHKKNKAPAFQVEVRDMLITVGGYLSGLAFQLLSEAVEFNIRIKEAKGKFLYSRVQRMAARRMEEEAEKLKEDRKKIKPKNLSEKRKSRKKMAQRSRKKNRSKRAA